MGQIFAKKLASSDNQPFTEMVAKFYTKNSKFMTSILSILPKWIIFVALIFPITGSALAQIPPEAVEFPLIVEIEQGITLHNAIINQIRIIDITGKSLKVLGNVAYIDVSDIPNGIYFLEVIYNNNQKQTTKIIINH